MKFSQQSLKSLQNGEFCLKVFMYFILIFFFLVDKEIIHEFCYISSKINKNIKFK